MTPDIFKYSILTHHPHYKKYDKQKIKFTKNLQNAEENGEMD